MPTTGTGRSGAIPTRSTETRERPAMAIYRYERDPEAIYRQSFAKIEAEADLARFPPALRALALRLVHASGMPEILADLAFAPDVAAAARAAIAVGGAIVADSEMTAAGIMRRQLGHPGQLVAALALPGVADHARAIGNTRSAAAIELVGERLDGAVVAIGNAPTALFRLLELMELEGYRPAAILAFPVGFVGAAESKEALIDADLGVPYLTLRGRRGGSALAAAAVNALLLAEQADA
jgi:precorrin-8X/cobalt-precorrin-8 methylmutase